MLDAEFIHGDDFKTPLTPAQEEHFNLIFSLNDTTNVGHIKVTELAQFMESLGHGLPIGSRMPRCPQSGWTPHLPPWTVERLRPRLRTQEHSPSTL